MTAPELLRGLLILTIIVMAALALFFLSRRRLTPYEFAAWGLLAILVPLLGPFLVIYLRPGDRKS
jgi:hypothetical protein